MRDGMNSLKPSKNKKLSGVLRLQKVLAVYLKIWSGKRGSNPRHSAWKADALPTELLPPGAKFILPPQIEIVK
jgi:hypothetical protein